jgi:hypothetical protein
LFQLWARSTGGAVASDADDDAAADDDDDDDADDADDADDETFAFTAPIADTSMPRRAASASTPR